MGNSELRPAFKNALKEPSDQKLGLTPEIIFEEELIDAVEKKIIERLKANQVEYEKTFTDTNLQSNENIDDLFKRKLICELNENFISGFATAESNIENLKEPCMYQNLNC